jgi:hypothetical protein
MSHTNPLYTTPSYFSKIHLNVIICVLIFLVVPFLLTSRPIPYTNSYCPHSCYMTCPPNIPRLGFSNYALRRVQITKPLVMQPSPTFCQFMSPQHLILKHPKCLFFP